MNTYEYYMICEYIKHVCEENTYFKIFIKYKYVYLEKHVCISKIIQHFYTFLLYWLMFQLVHILYL